jgi:hypothetical protein
VSKDGVVLHCLAVKGLSWDSLAEGWPPAEGCTDSVPSVEALHDAYVQRFDTFRDSERGARMQIAIKAVTERAEAGDAVTWEGLCALQRIVLDCESVGFREEPAHANARMETYGCNPRLEDVFAKTLARYDGDALHPLLKACRIYLDVRFFHPFAEGNSAAARLAFQWTLQRGGVRLPELTPLFRLPIGPGDLDRYHAFFDSAGSLMRQACSKG